MTDKITAPTFARFTKHVHFSLILCLLFSAQIAIAQKKNKTLLPSAAYSQGGFTDASLFGFSPEASGLKNSKALQAAVDKGGTILINKPGTYNISGTVYIGDSTSLVFGDKVIIQKSAENGVFTHVFLNKGAVTKTYNHHISITGLDLRVNGVDKPVDIIYGLRGHLAFFYVKDLKMERIRISGLINGQFAIHVCTFEDLLIDDAMLKGKKDGIHLGPGKRFRISNVLFETGDDAIALVPGDWVSANPEFGNLEDGLIENCTDLQDDYLEGGFAKIVSGGWPDWKPGLEVKHGDAVVNAGRIYRVIAKIDGKVYKSVTPPAFKTGREVLDSITWLMFQQDTIHTAQVRNVTFRNINLYSIRIPFQFLSYSNKYSHSYYPGAAKPTPGDITLDRINVLTDTKRPLAIISTPCDVLQISNTILRNNSIVFKHAADYDSYTPTYINFSNCIFKNAGQMDLVTNNSPGKEIFIKTSGSIETGKGFSAKIDQGPGKIYVDSDLQGLRKK